MTAIQKLAGHASIKMTLRYAHLSPRYLADEVKTLDKYHGNDEPADETIANAGGTPKEVATPNMGEPREADSNGSSGRPRKAPPVAVKAGKADSPMQGIGKK